MSSRSKVSKRLCPAILILLLSVVGTHAQESMDVHPRILYPGKNIVRISVPTGIRSVEVTFNDSISEARVFPRKTGIVGGCPEERLIELDVATATAPSVTAVLNVEDCEGRKGTVPITLQRIWNLDEVPFPDAQVGQEVCRPFRISMSGGLPGITGGGIYLDSVTIPSEYTSLKFSFPPPIAVKSGQVYRYNVCFQANEPGIYKFPVITWIRRNPGDEIEGLTTYPVADTGVIRVLPKRSNIDVSNVPLDTMGTDNPPPVTDPTTFRSVAVPNAVIPPRGSFFVGSYDLLGLTAGYSVADELMIFGGGAAPTPDDWAGVNGDMFGAWSAGAKLGTELIDKLDVAVGFHYGQSILDKEFTPDELESRISVSAPYGAISYGTDDSRVSVTGGYAFKHHSTWIPDDPELGSFREEYDRDAAFGALGGDYRLGRHWKIAGEAAIMETVDVVPIIGTARYFTNSFAIDFGVAFAGITLNEADAPKFPFLPVLSGVFVF